VNHDRDVAGAVSGSKRVRIEELVRSPELASGTDLLQSHVRAAPHLAWTVIETEEVL